MSDYKLLIDGKLVSGALALNVVNPATEEVVAVAPRADRAQLVVIDDVPCSGSPLRGIGLDRTCVGRPRRKHRPLFCDRHVGIPHNVKRVSEGPRRVK